jgi:hypothetical protein
MTRSRAETGITSKLFARAPQKKYDHDGSSIVYSYDFVYVLTDVLRMSAEIILVGELQDSVAAVAMLMSANTGTRGTMSTIHSNGILDTLYRIEADAQEDDCAHGANGGLHEVRRGVADAKGGRGAGRPWAQECRVCARSGDPVRRLAIVEFAVLVVFAAAFRTIVRGWGQQLAAQMGAAP